MGQVQRNAGAVHAYIPVLLAVLAFAGVGRSETVLDIVNEISQTSYTNYLTNMLYTHTGNNRGYDTSGNPRHPKPDHDAARDNIKNFFIGLGLSTQLDPFEFSYDSATYTGCNNVVAVYPGRVRPNDIYILNAHYDSVNNPGADDDASGIAGIMEAARVLSGHAFEATLIFIAFDAEELGKGGSLHYVANHLADHMRGTVVIDQIACNQNQGSVITGRRVLSSPVMDALEAACSQFAPSLPVRQVDQWNISDHTSFELSGFPACDFAEYSPVANPNWHKPGDTVDNTSYLDFTFAMNNLRAAVGYVATAAVLIPIATIQGTVTLDNFTGDKTAVPVTITINAASPETRTVNLDSAGHYSFTTTLSGTYDVTAKASHWLRKKAVAVTLGSAPVNFTLTNGDCDNNNAVNDVDLPILTAAIDTIPASDARADLDGNGEVNSTDLSILLKAIDTIGD